MFSTSRNKVVGTAILVMTLAAASAARAGQITLDVSATFSPGAGIMCAATGCTLGGDIVIDNSTGAPNGGFISADVTASGFSPVVGPFTIFDSIEDTFGSSPNTADCSGRCDCLASPVGGRLGAVQKALLKVREAEVPRSNAKAHA